MSFRRLTGKSGSDTERGKLILESTSLIRNSGGFVIEDVIEDLLRSGAWRTYTFPNGTHHEWLDREFDYFVSAQQFEWDKIRRSITKPEVLCLIADHSGAGPGAGKERRALEEVRDQFPHVELVKLVSDHIRKAAGSKTKRSRFERTGNIMEAAEGSRPWEFKVRRRPETSVDERAQAIVAKLQQDDELRRRVYQLLSNDDRTRRRANGQNKPKTRKVRDRTS